MLRVLKLAPFGISPVSSALTPEQRRIQELEERVK